METAYGWGGSVDEVTQVVEELRNQGVAAEVRPDPRYEQPWWDRIESPSDRPGEPTASLVYTPRHDATVWAVLRSHGIRPPDAW
jgi:hypothetical protein